MERLPLHVLVSSEEEVVLFNGEIVACLTSFDLDISDCIKTTFRCIGCFPGPSGLHVREATKYPLRIYVGNNVEDTVITCRGKPIGVLRNIQVKLSATQKRIIRFTSYVPFPEELKVVLLDLGVELIVEPPGDENANL